MTAKSQTQEMTPAKKYVMDHDIKMVRLAQQIGLSSQNLSLVINGWASEQVTRHWAPRIAAVLEVPVELLFPGVQEAANG